MSAQPKEAEDIAVRAERAKAIARQITKDSWLASGRTEEQWERGEIIGEVFGALLAQGCSEDEANDYLENASWEKIERKHQALYPHRQTR